MSEVFRLRAESKKHRWLGVRESTMPSLPHVLSVGGVGNSWTPPTLEELIDDELPSGPLTDFPYLDGVPVFSRRAVELLADLLVENGELLPTIFDLREYFVYNVTRIADVLDESNSDVDRFKSGEIMEVKRFAFFPDRLSGLLVFKIPQLRQFIFVTTTFKERVKRLGLTGFVFEAVWSSSDVAVAARYANQRQKPF